MDLKNQPAGSSLVWFRNSIVAFAIILGCQAIWIITPEFLRPPSSRFPADSQAAEAIAANREAAKSAAWAGLVRGDLWAESALTYLNVFWSDEGAKSPASDATNDARVVAERALTLSPHDSRIWLTLASLDLRFDWLNRQAENVLRMAYFTGSNDIDSIPLRLAVAVRTDALGESDMQQFVRRDIRLAVARAPELKPAIIDAYRDALPNSKRILEGLLEELDPALLAAARAQ